MPKSQPFNRKALRRRTTCRDLLRIEAEVMQEPIRVDKRKRTVPVSPELADNCLTVTRS